MKFFFPTVALFLVTASTAAADGKKGMADEGGMGGAGGGGGGKKGSMSFSFSMAVEPIESGPAFCNSGLAFCEVFLRGCSEFQSNLTGLLDTDSCLAFCEENMEAENYYVEFRPSIEDASANDCFCYEACQKFDRINEAPRLFSVNFAVGDATCDYFPGLDDFQGDTPNVFFTGDNCTGTEFTECEDGAKCLGTPINNLSFTNAESLQNCVDLCFGTGGIITPVVEFLGGAGLNCRCFQSDADARPGENCNVESPAMSPGTEIAVVSSTGAACPESD